MYIFLKTSLIVSILLTSFSCNEHSIVHREVSSNALINDSMIPIVSIDRKMLNSLSHQDEVLVIINLQEPPRSTAIHREQQISDIQNKVLSTLSSNDFRLKHRYEYIFSISGWVRKSGLSKLQNNPFVAGIVFDGLSYPTPN